MITPISLTMPIIPTTVTPPTPNDDLFKLFEEKIWEYIDQLGKVFKQILKVIIIKVPEYAARLAKVIAGVGLMAGVSVLWTVKGICTGKWCKCAGLADAEGVIYSTLELLNKLADILKDVGSFVEALSDLGAFPKVAFFGLIGLPLSVSLLCYSVLSKTYDLIHNGVFLSKLPQDITAENRAAFEAYIREQIDDPAQDVRKRKIQVLARRADPKVCAIFEKFHTYDLPRANQALQDIKTLMGKKITLGCVGTFANVAMVTTLIASAFFGLHPLVLPVVSILKAGVSIGTHSYKTEFLYAGVHAA